MSGAERLDGPPVLEWWDEVVTMTPETVEAIWRWWSAKQAERVPAEHKPELGSQGEPRKVTIE